MAAYTPTTLLTIEVNADESLHNAVLWYESDLEGRGREVDKTIVKTKFAYANTEPVMKSFFHRSDALVAFLKVNVDPQASRAVLYSTEGWQSRNRIKKEVEKGVESCSLWLCCATCGCAVLCCGLCGACDRGVNKLNEDYYCSTMKEENPEQASDTAFEFVAASGVTSAPVVLGQVLER